MFGKKCSLALGCLVLLIAGGCKAQVRNCAQIESCIEYFEGPCTNGRRNVCIRFRDTAGTICAPPTFVSATTQFCLQNTFLPSTPGVNNFFCSSSDLVAGGDFFSFGIMSSFSTENTDSRSVTISNFPNGQATCSGYESVCSATGNNDFRLTFRVSTCTGVSTTTPMPNGCICTAFFNFGSCSTTCGAGFQQQRRSCSNCPPFITTDRFIPCNNSPCTTVTPPVTTPGRVDGMWGPWGPFSTCTATCGGGTQKRTRTCNNPPPSGGGQGCTEPMMETVICNQNTCGGGSGQGCRRRAKNGPCSRFNGRALRRCIRARCRRRG